MKTYIEYSEISKEERKSLATEAYRRSASLRLIRFAAVLLPTFFSGAFTHQFAPNNLGARFAFAIGSAVALCVVIWEVFGRPKLKAEVERLKNA